MKKSLMRFLIVFIIIVFTTTTFEAFTSLKVSATSVSYTGYLIDDDFTLSINDRPSGWNIPAQLAGTITDVFGNYLKITDTGTTDNISINKPFVTQAYGKIVLEYRFKLMNNIDGVSWSLNSDSESAIKIVTDNGNLCYVKSDGTLGVLTKSYTVGLEYGVKVTVDITNKTADYVINGQEAAKAEPFISENISSLNNICISTGEKSVGELRLGCVKLYKGYLLNEKLISSPVSEIPGDWKKDVSANTSVKTKSFETNLLPDIFSFCLEDTSNTNLASLSKSFDKESNSVIFEYKFLLTDKTDGIKFELKSGTESAVNIFTKDNNIYCLKRDGSNLELVKDYKTNLWYYVKVKYNPNETSSTGDFWINNKTNDGLKNVNLPNRKMVDAVKFSTSKEGSASTLWVDDILVYDYQNEPSDYVPEPVIVKNDSKIVGIQSCSLWREGTHYGWDRIAEYPERISYLGKYDEGNPEVSDWEIKWMVEHGIDYQMYCWYRPASSFAKPIKETPWSAALDKGYFNAKYSDKMKFSIMWENMSLSNAVKDSADFRNNVVPYWIEYFFKDPRYQKYEGRPILGIFSIWSLIKNYGSVTNVRKDMDYLREQCIAAGVGNPLIILNYNGTSESDLIGNIRSAGVDAVFNYSWGNNSGDISYQEDKLNAQVNPTKNTKVDLIPTLSMGRDNLPWAGSKGTFTTASTFEQLLNWEKDTLTNSLPQTSVGRDMVLLDNWNEYGEGHFIMPTSLQGFGYLNAISNVFGNSSPHVDVVPNDDQKSRFDVLNQKVATKVNSDSEKLVKGDNEGSIDNLTNAINLSYSDSVITMSGSNKIDYSYITGVAWIGKEITLVWDNVGYEAIVSGGNIDLIENNNFAPETIGAEIKLIFDGVRWKEVLDGRKS